MAITIQGLEQDNYLVNNPILVRIKESSLIDYYSLNIGSYTNIIVTPINASNEIVVDISSYVKSMFPLFNQNSNMISVQFNIRAIKKEMLYPSGFATTIVSSVVINKFFCFGGRRINKSNQIIQPSTVIKVTDKLPLWLGYPLTESIAYLGSINHSTPLQPSPLFYEQKKIKGCNSIYVKFLNSLGGYSYWLFEGISDQQKNNHLGILNNSHIEDLGNDLEKEIELYSKVSRAYMPLMQDLIISPEIYIYRLSDGGFEWDRYYSGSNTVEFNPAKSAQEIKVKLKPFLNFKPTTIWQ